MTGVLTSAYDSLSLRVSYLHDVGNEHDSYIITPSIGYGTPLGTKTYAGVGVSADYVGKGYSQTYFGVTPAGAGASGLPASRSAERRGGKEWVSTCRSRWSPE